MGLKVWPPLPLFALAQVLLFLQPRGHRFRSRDHRDQSLSHWQDRHRAPPRCAVQPATLSRALLHLSSVVAAVPAALLQARRLPPQISVSFPAAARFSLLFSPTPFFLPSSLQSSAFLLSSPLLRLRRR